MEQRRRKGKRTREHQKGQMEQMQQMEQMEQRGRKEKGTREHQGGREKAQRSQQPWTLVADDLATHTTVNSAQSLHFGSPTRGCR